MPPLQCVACCRKGFVASWFSVVWFVLSSNMAANTTRVSSPIAGVVHACKEPYSEQAEYAAVEAVAAWLDDVTTQMAATSGFSSADREDGGILLMIASETGYPKVVQTLLKDKNVVECELKLRAEEMWENPSGGPSGFTVARYFAKHARRGELYCVPASSKHQAMLNARCKQYEPMQLVESAEEWEGVNGRKARCKSCYDMITLYVYIGEEIADVPTLARVISALHELGWETMNDIQENWGDIRGGIREELRKESKVESALVTRLSEVLVNYRDNWAKPFEDERHMRIKEDAEEVRQSSAFCGLSGYVGYKNVWLCGLLLIVCVPGTVLAIFDLVHYEGQLWWKFFVWMSAVVIAQTLIVFLTAPYLGWGMIKESSRDKDLGVTLRGSMSTQAIVSTLLFSTTMSKLQIDLNSLDMVVDFNKTASNSEQYAGFELAQWYAVKRHTARCTT